MKLLVIGGHGLLGSKLISLAASQEDMLVCGTVRRPADPLPGVRFFQLDITDADQVNEVIDQCKPDVVCHTAAMTQADECEKNPAACHAVNTACMPAIIQACNRNHAQLIYLSTDFVFDGTRSHLDEEDEPAPVNYYGACKLAAEALVKEQATHWSIVRTVLVYGTSPDMSRSNLILWVKQNLEQGKPIKVVNDQWRTPTYVDDLAEGCLLVARRQAQGIFHIAGKDFMSPYEIALKTAAFFNLDASLITPVSTATFIQPAKRPLKTGFNISKARIQLGYEPRPFDEGLALMARQLG